MTVHLDLDGAIARITLDSPPLNVFDLEMRDGLIEAIDAIRDLVALSDELRVVILRSAGRHFSAGADLSEFGTAESIMEARRIRWDRDPWGPLWDLPLPTVAALRGVAVGSGMEMSLLCDLRVAADDLAIGLPETKLGMLPAAGGTQSLARAIGRRPATVLVAAAPTLDASEAERRGIVHRVVPVDQLDDAATLLAEELAQADPQVMAAARRCLRASGDLPLADGLALERRLADSFLNAGEGRGA